MSAPARNLTPIALSIITLLTEIRINNLVILGTYMFGVIINSANDNDLKLHDMRVNLAELTQANPMLCVYCLGRSVKDTGASAEMCDRLEVTPTVLHSEAQQLSCRKILISFSCNSLLLLHLLISACCTFLAFAIVKLAIKTRK